MKLLLVGPYPPPHGGVSVHVKNLHETMLQAGTPCAVLNTERRAPQSDRYIKICGALDFAKELMRHTFDDWTLHVHTNGHNTKSWLVALQSGLAAQFGPGCYLTLHSGMLPEYLRNGPAWRRTLARFTCLLYDRIICVNAEIAETLSGLGVSGERMQIQPAYLPRSVSHASLPEELQRWMQCRSPILSTALFFRPEYGLELLLGALTKLRRVYPNIGCVVMGGGDDRPDPGLLEEHIRFTGDVHHDQCLALMSRSDVFVRPTFHDGDSISVREAHALGLPVVASNVGTRPPGTVLFQAGDVEGLVRAVESVFRRRASVDAQSPALPQPAAGSRSAVPGREFAGSLTVSHED